MNYRTSTINSEPYGIATAVDPRASKMYSMVPENSRSPTSALKPHQTGLHMWMFSRFLVHTRLHLPGVTVSGFSLLALSTCCEELTRTYVTTRPLWAFCTLGELLTHAPLSLTHTLTHSLSLFPLFLSLSFSLSLSWHCPHALSSLRGPLSGRARFGPLRGYQSHEYAHLLGPP